MKVVKIDTTKCIKCQKCYDLCPEDIFEIGEDGIPVHAHDGECWFCGICWLNCPKRCIEIRLPASLW